MSELEATPTPAWFSELPSTWNSVPVRRLFRHVRRIAGEDAHELDRLSLTMNGVLPRDKEAFDGLQPADFRGYQVIEPSDLVFKLIDLQNIRTSRVGISGARGLVSPAYIALRSIDTDRAHPRYFYYYFLDLYWRQVYQGLAADGVRANLGARDLLALPAPQPPVPLQLRIAAFLDHETGRIDQLIGKQEQLVSTLAERLDSLQMQLALELEPVHRGKLGRYLRKLNRRHITGTGTVTAFRDGQVTLRSNRREEGFTFSQNDEGYQGVEPGDLVFHGLDGFAGAVGVSESSGACSPVYHVCAALPGHDPRYLALVLRALGASGFLFTLAANVRQRSIDFRTWTAFAAIPVALPSHEEQLEAVERFEASRERVNELTAAARASIGLLRERRQALISAAVTGRIDVGGAS